MWFFSTSFCLRILAPLSYLLRVSLSLCILVSHGICGWISALLYIQEGLKTDFVGYRLNTVRVPHSPAVKAKTGSAFLFETLGDSRQSLRPPLFTNSLNLLFFTLPAQSFLLFPWYNKKQGMCSTNCPAVFFHSDAWYLLVCAKSS